MGKRELLLILAFAVAGVLVYQFTAPPTPEGRGSGLGGLIQSARREIQGNRARAEHTTTTTAHLDPAVDELRVDSIAGVTLVGEDRTDLALEFTVSSTGYDEPEAQKLARATTLRLDTSGRVVSLSVDYPDDGQQRATLEVHIPSHLRTRVRGSRETRVTSVAAVMLDGTRGDVTVEHVAGRVEGSQTGGTVTVTDANAVDLTGRSMDLTLESIAAGVKLEMVGGTVKAGTIGGGLEVNGRSVDVEAGPIGGLARFGLRGGSVELRAVRHEVRFDGRETDLTIAMAAPAPVTAITSDATISFTPPPAGGFTLDAAATDGHVRLDGLEVAVKTEGSTEHASGAVRGGGPTVALRTTDGAIEVRRAEGAR
jgi:hypothetical protein